MKMPYRVRQVIYYTRTDRQEPPPLPQDVRALLSDTMEAQFRLLSSGDQRHLLRVYRYLKAHGAATDTATAGLLHDIGKACRKCHINVIDRCLHVFCKRFLATPYRLFANSEAPAGPLLGVHRLANHAHRGAEAARQAGYNERVQWLIEHHERGGNPDDVELSILRYADDNAGPGFDA